MYTHGRIFDIEECLKVGEEVRIYASQRLENRYARQRIFDQLRTLDLPMKTVPTVTDKRKDKRKTTKPKKQQTTAIY